MRAKLLLAAFAAAVGGCTTPTEVAPASATPTTIAAPALTEIPRAPAQPVARHAPDTATPDLDAIIERGHIRILVARSGTHFHTSEGAHAGKSVDVGVALARALSDKSGKPVTPVFIETREADLIANLLAGKGDVAANILLTFARDEQVAFAPPIRTGIREVVVTSAKAPLVSLEDVGSRTIHVRRDSDHHASVQRLNEQLRKIDRPVARIVLEPATITDEQLVERVNDGRIPATVVDDYILKPLPHVAVNRDIAVSQDGSLSWVTRKDASKLIDFMKEFFATHQLTF